MNLILRNNQYIDPATGEILPAEQVAVFCAGKQAAQASHHLELDKAKLAALRAEIEAFITSAYPQLKPLEKRVIDSQADYEKAEKDLREAALAAAAAGAQRSFLGGAILVKQPERVTFWNEERAVEWAKEQQHPELLKISAEKKKFEGLARAGQLPEDVMKVEVVPETAITGAKLMLLLDEA